MIATLSWHELKQKEDVLFISQESYANEILKKFKIDSCKMINISMECKIKLSMNDEAKKVNTIIFKSLVRSLWYLACRDLTFYKLSTRLISRYMENPTTTHLKIAKRVIH